MNELQNSDTAVVLEKKCLDSPVVREGFSQQSAVVTRCFLLKIQTLFHSNFKQ